MSFLNNSEYNVVTENELAQVLSNYSSEFVLSIVEEMMKKRFERLPIVSPPNVVGEWEQNFKAILMQYGSDATNDVLQVRESTYNEIIERICKEFNLTFTIDESVDKFSAAYNLYDIFVCNFLSYMVSFFANFIYSEKNSLYESISEQKKNKDSGTIYGKKIFKDPKIAIINANIDTIITDVICQMDIPFYKIISTMLGENSERKNYILNIVSSGSDFFRTAYIPVLNSDIQPDIITAIRFAIQEYAVSNDQMRTMSEVINTKDEEGE